MRGERFYGWRIVGAAFVVLFITVGAGIYVPPVFLKPLQEEFGWSRALISGGTSVAALVCGLASPLAGAWIDRYGSRVVMVAGGIAMTTAFLGFAYIREPWQLYACNILAALGITCAAWIPNQTLIANWFVRQRGLAMGIALTGIGFGGLVMVAVAARLIDLNGWRWAFAILSALVFLGVVPVTLLVVRGRPADMGLYADGDQPSAAGSAAAAKQTPVVIGGTEVATAVRSRNFWILCGCNFLATFAFMSVVVHLAAFLSDGGLSRNHAAVVLAFTVGASVFGRVLFGLLADRVSRPYLMAAGFTVHGLAILLLLRLDLPLSLPGFIAAFGLAMGGTAVLGPLLVGDCFGLRDFAKILGLSLIPATLGAAIGPVLTGYVYDVTASYHPAFVVHCGAFLSAALAITFLRLPRQGVKSRLAT